MPSFRVRERSPEADVALVRRARGGDLQAREELCASCLGVVRAVALHYQGLGLAVDDLVQEGSIGLLDAIGRFDPARGVAFRAFAAWRIRRAILEAVTDQSRLVRLPKGVVQARRAVAQADARLTAALGHTPSERELAAETGLPGAAVAAARRASPPPASLDGDGTPLATMLADTAAADPEAEAVAHERSHQLATALARLDSRELEIVCRHFGLDGAATPIPEVARRLGLSDERTRALERHALFVLRRELESAGLSGGATKGCSVLGRTTGAATGGCAGRAARRPSGHGLPDRRRPDDARRRVHHAVGRPGQEPARTDLSLLRAAAGAVPLRQARATRSSVVVRHRTAART